MYIQDVKIFVEYLWKIDSRNWNKYKSWYTKISIKLLRFTQKLLIIDIFVLIFCFLVSLKSIF